MLERGIPPLVPYCMIAVPPKTQPPLAPPKALATAAPLVAAENPPQSLRSRLRAWMLRRTTPAWLASGVAHLALLLVLALLVIPFGRLDERPHVVSGREQEIDLPDHDQPLLPPSEQPPTEVPFTAAAPAESLTTPDVTSPAKSHSDDDSTAQPRGIGQEQPDSLSWLRPRAASARDALQGRLPNRRAALAEAAGGSPASEGAVERGLNWLAAHQREDGSWRFNHHGPRCEGQCRNPGNHPSATGATGLALLAFLGAGYTHRHGEHQATVQRGLDFLRRRMVTTPHGGELQDGSMYGHAIAAIALCEAYALTMDPRLKEAADAAKQFTLFAQDKQGGGWRYTPGTPGDTTVTGWQLMVLKSAGMGYLRVPQQAFVDAGRFLDGVQANSGATYGYQTPGEGQTTTAVGLLCRMYLGWPLDEPGLERGVHRLAEWGPAFKGLRQWKSDDMYYNYYATQVLHHFGGYAWKEWNDVTRDRLVAAQAQEGHESGSWHFEGRHSEEGGRLMSTALAIMTLEVYYRHMPLYRRDVLDGF